MPFLPVIDDLPAFVLLISMVRSPQSSLPLIPLQCHSSLTAPCLQSSLSLPSPPSNSPPFSPLPHSYAFISFPKSPRSSHPLPPCMFQVSSFKEWVHIKTSTFLEARTGYCCIHRVKQTILHMIHMILSRSVHQITYGDVIKAFCKKTSLQRTPPSNGHYCSSQWCPLFGGFTVHSCSQCTAYSGCRKTHSCSKSQVSSLGGTVSMEYFYNMSDKSFITLHWIY